MNQSLTTFYIRGVRKNFEGVNIPPDTTKVVHILGRLESLKGIENFPSTVVELDVSYNFIRSVSGIEKTNIAILKIKGNDLESLENIANSNIKKLNIKGNPCEDDCGENYK